MGSCFAIKPVLWVGKFTSPKNITYDGEPQSMLWDQSWKWNSQRWPSCTNTRNLLIKVAELQEGESNKSTRTKGKKASTESPGPNIKHGCKVVDSRHEVTDSVDQMAATNTPRGAWVIPVQLCSILDTNRLPGIRRAKANALDNVG